MSNLNNNESDDLSQNETLPAHVGTVKTLVDVPDRAPLPAKNKVGRPCLLADMVEFGPDNYSKLIGMIKNGVSGQVAAEALGINEYTFYDWARRGKKDYFSPPRKVPMEVDGEIRIVEVPVDTYYSRFYSDVRRAVAQCRAELEVNIAASNPKLWLSNGPGRIFGTNWKEKDTEAPSVSDEEMLDVLTSSSSEDVVEEANEAGVTMIEVEGDSSVDALQVLEDAGIVETNRQYKKQVRKQVREENTDE